MRTRVLDLSHDGRGIAKVDGKVVFIEGALPEEEVTFEYLKRKKDYDEARVLEILQASKYRVMPTCQHFGVCGGCTLQHLSPEGQLIYKQQHWLQLMMKMGGGAPERVLQPLQASVWHYRRKARLGVKYVSKKQKTIVGFREKKQARYLMDMQECSILHEKFSQQFLDLKLLLNALTAKDQIAQIELAVGQELALVFRNLQALNTRDQDLLMEFGQRHDCKIYLQAHGPDSLQLLYPKDGDPELKFYLSAAQANLRFNPLDFIQVNAQVNEAMVIQALKLLDLKPDDRVLDLFCGLGNFTLALARHVKHVYGVEAAAAMIARAKRNAELEGFKNIDFLSMDLQDAKNIDQLQHLSCNKILLDPPRDGAFSVIEAMDRLNPERIVYVSCHPATLARDAAILKTRFGYRMLAGGVMDMFPHTVHIESMAVFIRD